ncbi:MAG: hypothetical protein JHC65_05795 [Ilumatobacteraceae bacterium]|nr:hypothetical protein [Ilumatobacteraceae bacterium]
MVLTAIKQLDQRLHKNRASEPSSLQTRIVLFVAVVCGIFMASVALRQAGPTVHPDEWGFLSNGQALIGHTEAPVPTGSFYPAGYGLITGLGALLTGSLPGAYRFALLANVVLAILTGWFAGRLAVRGYGASKLMGRIVSALVFVLPGTIVTAMFAWPETASRLAFLVFISLVITVAKNRSAIQVVGLGLFTGLMPALHGRFTLLIPVVGLVFLWWGIQRLISRRVALLALFVTAIGYEGSRLLNQFVKRSLYEASYDQESRLLRRLFNPSVWPALLRTMAGQTWYLTATSCGLVGVGIAFAIWRIRSEGGVRTVTADPQRLGLLVLVASSLLIIFTGGLQLLYGARGDHLIYGRYVEILVPALLVVACVGLEKSFVLAQRAWLLTGLFVGALSLIYVLIDRGDGVKGGYSRNDIVFPNIVGTDVVRYLVTPSLVNFGAVFVLAALVLWTVSRLHGTWSVVVLTVALGAGSMYSGSRSILSRTDDLVATTQTLAKVKDSGTQLVGFDMGVRNDRSYYYLRYKLHPIKIVRFDISGPDAVIPVEYSCVYGMPNKPPTDGQWAIVADEVVLQRVLFQRVGTAQC